MDSQGNETCVASRELFGKNAYNIRQMFYLVTPWEIPYEYENTYPHSAELAVPWMVVLMLLEFFYYWRRGESHVMYDVNDSITCALARILVLVVKIAFRGIEFSFYSRVYENYAIVRLPYQSPWTWILSVLVVDLCYYWFHRAAHEISILWTFHQAHHSSEYYNLTTALRLGMFQDTAMSIFYLPEALFVPPQVHVVHLYLNQLYQTWLHTQVVTTLGPLEQVIYTPSHHRVHHGRNPYCIDKNYGGLLIIWDKLFGTYEPERKEEPVVYGLLHNVNSFDQMYLQFFNLKSLFCEKMVTVPGLGNKLKAMFYGPGWDVGKPRLGDLEDIPEVEYPVKPYKSNASKWVSMYVAFQGFICLYAIGYYAETIRTRIYRFAFPFAAAIIFSIYVLGLLLENRWHAPYMEMARLVLAFYVLIPALWPVGMVTCTVLRAIAVICTVFWLTVFLMPKIKSAGSLLHPRRKISGIDNVK